jgi:hypothetical protein
MTYSAARIPVFTPLYAGAFTSQISQRERTLKIESSLMSRQFLFQRERSINSAQGIIKTATPRQTLGKLRILSSLGYPKNDYLYCSESLLALKPGRRRKTIEYPGAELRGILADKYVLNKIFFQRPLFSQAVIVSDQPDYQEDQDRGDNQKYQD